MRLEVVARGDFHDSASRLVACVAEAGGTSRTAASSVRIGRVDRRGGCEAASTHQETGLVHGVRVEGRDGVIEEVEGRYANLDISSLLEVDPALY